MGVKLGKVQTDQNFSGTFLVENIFETASESFFETINKIGVMLCTPLPKNRDLV